MKVSILATGNEIVDKKVEETNSKYIVEKIRSESLNIKNILAIKDDRESFYKSLKFLSEDSDIIFIIGGLGPTIDDITIESVSDFYGLELIEDRKVKEKILNYHKNKGQISEFGVKKQSKVIKSAEIFYNDFGTAPGQVIKIDNKMIIILPGPPHEFSNVFDKIYDKFDIFKNDDKIKSNLYFYGVTEMDLTKKIEYLKIKEDYGIYIIKNLGLRLDINYDEEIFKFFRNEYGSRFLGTKNLLENFFEIFINNKLTLALAESCTGGKLSDYITSKSGSSKFFKGSFITYSNELKNKILNVNLNTLNRFGAVSKECVLEMSKGLKNITNSDVCISISGIAGPTGGTKEKPVGTVYFGLIIDDEEYSFKKIFNGEREDVKEKAVYYSLWKALDLLQMTGRLSNE
ncbi:MAG: nicotinamide-nucleotide amidase [Geotoga sp.]|nr:nicotinamide-nucleotide amidase [Geotoga sp.]